MGASTTTNQRRSAAEEAGDVASRLAEQAAAQAGRAFEGAETVARKVVDAGREAQQNVENVAGNFKEAVDSSVRQQPITTLVVAAALGFVLGALWKS
jgi:ElaB/YqjD/DUF883 family membrane-anchored ribosome-binding protein